MKQLLILPNSQDETFGSITFNDASASITLQLQADTEQTITVPPYAKFALFEYAAGATVFVSPDTIATPAINTNQTDRSSINPLSRVMQDNSPNVTLPDLKFLSAADTFCKVNFYSG